ncbi:hypothetical protein TWF506_005353 [Arthrobotrys conoides]|uniref:Uncharacterized protein n=1 Tax=Arthrobotrys conoides TaxID=74498 RepID=A0AAN8NE17_9PEZI
MKYAFKAKSRQTSRPAMNYREFLKWQESFCDRADSIRLFSKIRNIPFVRQSALPDPLNPRDWSFNPNGEAEVVQKWNRKKDDRRRAAVRIMKAFKILYKRDEHYDRVDNFADLRRKIRAFYIRSRFFVWITVIAPGLSALGIFYLYLIFVFNISQIFRYVYWDWTLNPRLMHPITTGS